LVLGLPLIALLIAGARAEPVSSTRFDLILRNGTVFDGSGREGVRQDVGIIGDRILAVGNLSGRQATREEDVSGLYVIPGIINVHDHTVPESLTRPEGLLTQGVTTAIANPDGGGSVDIVKQLSPAGGLGLNYGAYIGFNAIWQSVVGNDDRRPSDAEIARMRGLVTQGLEAGAFGISSGLDYKPSFWAKTDEVIRIVEAGRGWHTGFPNHERVYPGNGYSSLAGITETIEIGKAAGLMPVVTHMNLQGASAGKVSQLFAMFDRSRSQGVPVGADALPYAFGTTALDQLLIPNWAQDGGREAMLARFKVPALRKRIAAESSEIMDRRWNGPGGVYLDQLKQPLPQVMKDMGDIDAGEAVIRLVEQGLSRVILYYGTESDMLDILRNPLTALSCDCGARNWTFGHPRQWGSYPHFLGRLVREQKLMPWKEAVRRMTAVPAAMVGLTERGYLMPGMIADITIFDPNTISDRATIEQPTLPSVGVRLVLINGKLALKDAERAPVPVGMRMIRSRHEASRPMDFRVDRHLDLSGRLPDGTSVALTLGQGADAERPKGKVSLRLAGAPIAFTPSILQTADRWASVTGIGRWPDGRVEALTLLVEQADPLDQGHPHLTVLIDGAVRADGGLQGRVGITRTPAGK
jgi:N-acyl-D-aspartate/D-glutamate deacylase